LLFFFIFFLFFLREISSKVLVLKIPNNKTIVITELYLIYNLYRNSMARTYTYAEVHKVEFVLMQPELDECQVAKALSPPKSLVLKFTGLMKAV